MRIPSTPAGEQLGWYLATMGSNMQDLTVEEANRHFTRPMEETDEQLRANWRAWSERLGQRVVTGVEVSEPFQIVVAVATDNDTRYRLTLSVESAAAHRITDLDWQRLYDSSIVIREATAEDGPALAEIERRAPIRLGERRMTFDRSADYFAAARLMEDATVVVAEVDGDPGAVEWAARHHARIGGAKYRLVNYIHLRVAAEHQGKGLWGALARKLSEKYAPQSSTDEGYQCAARDNASIQKAFAGAPRWRFGPVRALLSAERQAGPRVGREATADDAERIAELLNVAHGQEEMYFPYTADSLRDRLERAPELYSWNRVWLTDRAVVGVWPAGTQIKVITEMNGQVTETRRRLVLDYGFVPGAEAELEGLLRAWCGWLAGHGHTHLSIFTSEPSRGFSVIRGMADDLERFDLWTPPIREPEGAARHGVLVDQIYF